MTYNVFGGTLNPTLQSPWVSSRKLVKKYAHQDTEQVVVKEDVGKKISANGWGYTSMWQQVLLRTENNGRTLCMPPTIELEDCTRQR